MAAPSGDASTGYREAPDIPPLLSDSPVVSSALPGIPPFPILIGVGTGIQIFNFPLSISGFGPLDPVRSGFNPYGPVLGATSFGWA